MYTPANELTGGENIKKQQYIKTSILLIVNMLFWMRLLALYIGRFTSGGETVYSVIAVLLILDMAAYGALALGLWRQFKPAKLLLVPFLIVNAILSITDDIGFWDIAALTLNLVTILAFFLERKKSS